VERRTVSEVVGLNIRARRQARRLSHAQVIGLLAEKGLVGPKGDPISRSTLNEWENGKRAISVDDLVTIGEALGVPPHVLLYPQPDVDAVGRDDNSDHNIPAMDLAHWLWFSDAFPLTDERERSERTVWAESARILDRLPAEEIKRLAETYGPLGSVRESSTETAVVREQLADEPERSER
jgi:transcriptional regulator with XRE-family HTH domain